MLLWAGSWVWVNLLSHGNGTAALGRRDSHHFFTMEEIEDLNLNCGSRPASNPMTFALYHTHHHKSEIIRAYLKGQPRPRIQIQNFKRLH